MIDEEVIKYIAEATQRFAKEASVSIPEDTLAYVEGVLDNPIVFQCTLVGRGFIVGMVAPSFLNPAKKQAQELAWYVDPDFRGTGVAIKLLRMYEREAARRGCDEVGMVCIEAIDPERTGRIYEDLGYRKYETHYMKELRDGSV